MIRLNTVNEHTKRVVINPNDTLDFISSFEKNLNNMLADNNEKLLKSIKITLGASKETSEQTTSSYKGVEGNAYVVKKALAGGDNGYFSDSRERKVYSVFKDGKRIDFKNFDNHIKIRFRCRTALERETLRSFIILMLTFETKSLNCVSADLDYITDLETIQNELFVIDVFIHARTSIKWTDESTAEPLKETLVIANDKIIAVVNDDDELENGFL